VSEQQLLHVPVEPVLELELVDGTIADDPSNVAVPALAGIEARNLFGEAERIAARAASASTRRQYASIFRAFGDWLAGELGRPPLVSDLDTDTIAATRATSLWLAAGAHVRRRPRPRACIYQ
jgi:hypothetical protein